MVPVPPYPPYKIQPGSLPSSAFFPVSSLFLPIASSLSVSVQSADYLQQRLVTRRPYVGSLQTSADCRPKCPLLVSCPASRMRFCTPPSPSRPVRLVVLGLGVGRGAKETATPAMVLSSSRRQQAWPGIACLRRRSRNSIPLRGSPSPLPLFPHPSQVPPAA